MAASTETTWRIAGEEVGSCNCVWACPCQFNALPDKGYCEALIVEIGNTVECRTNAEKPLSLSEEQVFMAFSRVIRGFVKVGVVSAIFNYLFSGVSGRLLDAAPGALHASFVAFAGRASG